MCAFDDEFSKVRDGVHFGAAVHTAGTRDRLPYGDEPIQDGAIKRRQDFRLQQLVLDQLQRLVAALEIVLGDLQGIFGDIQFDPGVVEDLLRHELVIRQLLGAIEIEFHLLHRQREALTCNVEPWISI
jgi:hypothetical protein